jgi:DNA-3-methyladenine glycosylase I
MTADPVRCFGDSDPLYADYHDREWGRPVTGEQALLERICLEGFQSGLSWLTILRKRDAFRDAFAGFDPDALARFGDDDVERLLGDPRIVRHRGKIEAAIANGRATAALHANGQTLGELVWSFRPDVPRPPVDDFAQMPATTPESIALSKELKRRGFRFVGPTTAYAGMQACGLVNDHLASCHVHDDVEREQRAVAIRAPAPSTSAAMSLSDVTPIG